MIYRKVFKTLILLITLTVSIFYFSSYGKKADIFYGDALGYYLYLPTTFIYDNLERPDLLPKDSTAAIQNQVLWSVWNMKSANGFTEKGYLLNQYTYGVALMEAPFFFMAHAFEKTRGDIANGFSPTYSNFIRFSSIIYTFLGLLLIYIVLRKYFSSTLSLLTICLILIGTNLFWFTFHQAGMSHAPLFFLYAMLIYLTIKLYEKPVAGYFMLIGFVVGIITLIRPTDIVSVLIPLLYKVYDKETLRQRWRFIGQHYKKIILAALVFLLPCIPQFLYWKMMTGSYLFYSYGEQSFNWLHPKIIQGLFYFSNGWFAYTPLMLFAMAGMLLYKNFKEWAACVWLLLPIYVYIIYSWYCYNYINGFGSRPMIHLYPLLAIPLAVFIKCLWQKPVWAKGAFTSVCVFFIALNVSNSMQVAKNILVSEDSHFRYNWQMLFRMKMRYDDLVLKDTREFQPDTSKLQRFGTIACQNYEDSLDAHYVFDHRKGGKFVYLMQNESHLERPVDVIYDKKKFDGAKWFMCKGKFLLTYIPHDVYYKHTMVLDIHRGNKQLLWKGIHIYNKLGIADDACIHRDTFNMSHYEINEYWNAYFFARIPEDLKDGDRIRLYVWNMPNKPIRIDDLCIDLYK